MRKLLLIILGLMVYTLPCSAQQIKYAVTKQVYDDGRINEWEVSDFRYRLNFNGNTCNMYYYTGSNVWRIFKFDHKEGPNSVYYYYTYREAWGPFPAQWEAHKNEYLLVSPDKKTINFIHYVQDSTHSWRTTEVLKPYDEVKKPIQGMIE